MAPATSGIPISPPSSLAEIHGKEELQRWQRYVRRRTIRHNRGYIFLVSPLKAQGREVFMTKFSIALFTILLRH